MLLYPVISALPAPRKNTSSFELEFPAKLLPLVFSGSFRSWMLKTSCNNRNAAISAPDRTTPILRLDILAQVADVWSIVQKFILNRAH